MQRRDYLSGATTLLAASVAGCSDLVDVREDRGRGNGGGGTRDQILDDRPDAVYVPTHVDDMGMIGTAEAGDYTVGLMFSFAHGFWTVTGANRERVEIQDDEDVHLMATVWDGETGTVLPVGSGLTLSLERDGEFVTERSPWPMISQNMGFHFGDNFALDGAGTYTVTASIAGMGIERLGDFEGRFAERGEADLEWEFSTTAVESLGSRQTGDRAGDEGAVDLMEMDMLPTSVVPEPASLPGRVLGEGESHDARFVATAVEEPPFADGGTYLLVSPRTPYNRVPLPMMSLSVTLERDGEVVHEGALAEAIEPDAGLHYGVAVDDIAAGDDVTISVDSPPQVSRHEGYEMAFLEMPDVEFTVE